MQLELNETSFRKVKDVKIPDIFSRRVKTGIDVIDQIMDGGYLPGSAFMVAAGAGTGKTTLMLQQLQAMAKQGYNVAYCSGEESIYQVAHTSKRLNVKDVNVCNETDLDTLIKYTEDFDILVVDSFQSITTKKRMNTRQKENTAVTELVKAAKRNECVVGLIMHLTKDGKFKGSTIVPHTVDTCINISVIPGADDNLRNIYINKNRFGPLGSLECYITCRGYDFETKVIKDDSVTYGNKKAGSKNSRRKLDLDKLRGFNKLSFAKVMKECDCDIQRAQHLLRDLTIAGEYTKSGRSSKAIWTRTKKIKQEKPQPTVEVFLPSAAPITNGARVNLRPTMN